MNGADYLRQKHDSTGFSGADYLSQKRDSTGFSGAAYLRQKYGVPQFDASRIMDPVPSQASSTDVARPPLPFVDAQFRDRPPEGLSESLQSVGGGMVAGAFDIEKGKTVSPLGKWATEFEGYPGQTAGQGLGILSQYLLSGGVIGAASRIPKIAKAASKLPGMVRGAIRSGATGGLAAGVQQVAKAGVGEDLDLGSVPRQAAEFAAIDVGLRGAGKLIKPLIKKLRGKGVSDATGLRETGTEVHPGGIVQEGGAAKGGANLEQQALGQAGRPETQLGLDFTPISEGRNRIASLLGKGKEKIKTLAEPFDVFKQARNRVKLPESKRIVGRVEKADERAAGFRGRWGERYTNAIKGVKDGEQLALDLQAGKNPQLRSLMNDIQSELKRSGSDLGYVKNYFPRWMKQDVAEAVHGDLRGIEASLLDTPTDQAFKAMLAKKSEATRDIVEHLHKQGMSYMEAITMLRKQTSRELFPAASFEKARVLELPASVYETDAAKVIPRYIKGAADRVAQLNTFGKKGKQLDAILKKVAEKDMGEAKIVTRIVDTWSGKYAREHGLTGMSRKLSDAAVAAEVGLKIGLGTATIPNITQPLISTILDLGTGNFVKGTAKLAFKSQRAKVRQTGAIRDAIYAVAGTRPGGTMGKFSDLTTELSGFKGINKINLYTAASAFESAVKSWYKKAGGVGFRARAAQDRLKDYGFDYRKAPDTDLLSQKMYRFATDSQLQKNVLNDPLFFNTPKARPWVLFKRFGVRQAMYAKDVLLREIKREGLSKTEKVARTAPKVLRLAAGGYLGGEFVVWAKNTMKSAYTGDPYYRKDEHLTWERLVNNLAAVGTMGILTDIADSDSPRDFKNKARFLLTPVIASDVLETIGGDWQNVVGSQPKWLLRRTRSEEQKLRSRKIQRGKERTAILSLMAAGKSKEAQRRFTLWAESNPDLPFKKGSFSEKRIKSYRRQEIQKGK